MKAKNLALAGFFLLSINYVAFANRTLERAEILQIFEQLTNQPRKTWIPMGMIEAAHEEYRAPKAMDANVINGQINKEIQRYLSDPNKRELTQELQKMELDAIPFNVHHKLSNEYMMNSSVVVRFDGDRFYWEINVDSRTDSLKPGADLEGNFMTRQFDLNLNTRRIFVWDGEKYTSYFLPVNHAIVDTTGSTPHVVNGPLTAGIVPWGYGYYTYESLSTTDSSAVEKYIDGQMQINLTLNNSDGSGMLFVMDPQKDYAVLSCSINTQDNSVISKHYSNYQLISGNWVPATILIERYESNRLLARDLWNIIGIDANVPEIYEFDVGYEADALIEHFSLVTDEPAMYHHTQRVDTDMLLAERLAFAASEGAQPQNCATAALKYAVSQLGKDVTDSQLAQLVNEPNQQTNLYAMKQFTQGLGLFCRAIRTDVQMLKSLYDCQVILHIPGKEHFVILEAIDDKYVWTIDLASNKFYYRTDIDFFGMDWTEGTALIISNQSIELQGNLTEIDDVQLGGVLGSESMGYKCTRLLQEYNVIFCDYVGGVCLGYYREFYTRYGCEPAQAGNCKSSVLIRCAESPCILDPYNPFNCTITGEWTTYYMLACK